MGEFRDKVLDELCEINWATAGDVERNSLADAIERLHNEALAEAVKPWREALEDTIKSLFSCGETDELVKAVAAIVEKGNVRRLNATIAARALLAPKPPCGTEDVKET